MQLAALCCRAREKARRGQFPSFLPISEPAGEATSDPEVSLMHSSARLKTLESYHSLCFLTRRASRRPPKLDLDFLALIAIVNPSANVVFEQRAPPPLLSSSSPCLILASRRRPSLVPLPAKPSSSFLPFFCTPTRPQVQFLPRGGGGGRRRGRKGKSESC